MTMHKDIKNSLLSVEQVETTQELTAEFCFNNRLDIFKGHFPGMPILPGAAQIEMVRIAIESIAEHTYQIIGIKKAKFIEQMQPEDLITMTISLEQKNDVLRAKARLYANDKTASSIIMDLGTVSSKCLK
jgi:3-hydroxyacyl-[acyl-carrier-protein] dehydratase